MMKGADLKQIRERAGLLQPDFAAQLGVHSVTLSRFERDRQPIPLTVELAVCELDRRLSAPTTKTTKIQRKSTATASKNKTTK